MQINNINSEINFEKSNNLFGATLISHSIYTMVFAGLKYAICRLQGGKLFHLIEAAGDLVTFGENVCPRKKKKKK